MKYLGNSSDIMKLCEICNLEKMSIAAEDRKTAERSTKQF